MDKIIKAFGSDMDRHEARAYILTTVFLEEGKFIQRGSAPNWQGGIITLCTCMRQMRTYYSCDEWQNGNYWIAGFSSLEKKTLLARWGANIKLYMD